MLSHVAGTSYFIYEDQWHNTGVAAPSPSALRCRECITLEASVSAAVAAHDRAFNEWLSAVARGGDMRAAEELLKSTQAAQDHARRAVSRHSRTCAAATRAQRRYVFATREDAEKFAAYFSKHKSEGGSTPGLETVQLHAGDEAAAGHYDRIALLIGRSGPVFVETSWGKWKIEEPLG
jgi:hypothetical protein